MIIGLCIFYIGLQVIDWYFDLHWKEFTIGVIMLSCMISVLCFLNSMVISGIIWIVVLLIEYRTYLKYIKE